VKKFFEEEKQTEEALEHKNLSPHQPLILNKLATPNQDDSTKQFPLNP
jgi:hypothetical protein